MKLQDFEGIYKWKFLIPGIYIISWLLMILGPIFFPFGYQIYCIVIIAYSLLKTLGLGFGSLVSLIMLRLTLKQLAQQKAKLGSVSSQQKIVSSQGMLYHVIIIPSYKEDQEVLLQTLSILAKSWRAKSQFIIMLAMQAHEKGSDQKAKMLIEKTKHNFLHMGFTQHIVKQYEAKGKASNVSWCAEHLAQILPNRLMVDLKDIMLTIIDADSWAPAQYFDKIQIQLRKRPEIKDRCMFSVPQIYTRNHLDVPVFNRTYDQMHSLAQLSNLVAVYYSFPLSNYTISYNLAQKIGWWDTCADAIGQDFHTCQKCYWKLEQQSFVTVPIYIPFNQMSLSTGEGYCNDIKARFWQAERHTLGVSDVAYCWNMLFKTPFRFRNFILTLLVTEVFAMAAVIPWALLALSIQYKLVNNDSIHFFPMWLIDVLLNATSVVTLVSYIFYQWWKRISNKQVYLQQNDKWWRVFQYPILFMFALFGFSLPSFLIASFAVLCSAAQYRVAEKHVDKQNLHLNDPQKITNLPADNLVQSIQAATTEKPLNNPQSLAKKEKVDQQKQKIPTIEIQSVKTQSINLSIDQQLESQPDDDQTAKN